MPSSRKIVSEFIKCGKIHPEHINEALYCTHVSPNISSWFKFIDRLLFCLGILSLTFSVLFFIAYNWNDWGRFGKFTLIESLLIITTLLYVYVKKDHLKAQISLLVSSLMVGILMAFFGQTYQTGADPWTLFFFWALLITPWVVIARFAPLWLSWLALLNIALNLYIDSFGIPFNLFSSLNNDLGISTFILNTIALITLELSSRYFSYLSPRWLARSIASVAGFIITIMLIETIVETNTHHFPYILWSAFILSLYLVYRHLRGDLFMLAGACLSIIIVLVTFSIKQMNEDYFEMFFLFIPMLVIGLMSVATLWLKKVHKEMQS